MAKLLVIATLFAIIGAAVYFGSKQCCKKLTDLNTFRVDGYFGTQQVKDGKIPQDSTEIRPFTVKISGSQLADLKHRVANARFADHIEGTAFTYGFNSDRLKQVAEYWKTKYDWRKEEAKLNQYPQFLTQIEGLDIHFVHVKPSKPAKTVIPLLVSHGWPGSVLEYYKSFPLLTEPDNNGLAFEIIAPSIPGFGFSEASHKKGFTATVTARIYVKLMKRLGHEKFVIHGGDWGNIITRNIAIIYADNVLGAHIAGNWDTLQAPESPCQLIKTLFANYFPSLYFGSGAAAQHEYDKVFPLSKTVKFLIAESGYFHIQATKPDTVGAALVDSPVGLAAYILEKFSTGTNPANLRVEHGGLEDKFTMDELLTNVMIYWFSGNVASSLRYYRENVKNRNDVLKHKIKVPAGTVDSPHEFIRTPRALVEANYENLIQYSEFPQGGHFIAMEEPKMTCDDIRIFVTKVLEQQKQKAAEHQKSKKDEI